jgi:putative radical SAM enzyme (TIGR03279 family)
MGIEPGDVLLSIDDKQIEDIFDYRYLIDEDDFVMIIRKSNNEEWELDIEKSYDENIGIQFENELMSDYKACHNDCNFCFVSQMPDGMRDTLYFKDDDYRLSILQGNYITLTNLTQHDVDRIIAYRLEPLNISIHTMNEKLRVDMLRNKFAGQSLKIMDQLKSAGITMNAQIVLCKNYNDKKELVYSIEALKKYLPYLQSLTIVPVGLSKYREKLTQFDPFTKEDAKEVIEIVEKYQNEAFEKHGFYYIQASDEWYAMAGKKIPESKRYDGFNQLENGVGMLRLLYEEVTEALELVDKTDDNIISERTISVATGTMAYPFISELVEKITNKFPGIKVHVYKIINDYFGDTVTVAGLVTGTDLIAQLKNKNLGEKVIIPINMLRTGENVFLDNITVAEVEKALSNKIDINDSDGKSFVDHILYDLNEAVRNNETTAYIDMYNSY